MNAVHPLKWLLDTYYSTVIRHLLPAGTALMLGWQKQSMIQALKET